MTAFADDPVLAQVVRLTDDLLAVVAGLQDEQLREASVLPGWTRGHVLTHLSRNADALTRLLSGAAVGEQWPMYLDTPSRDEEIAAGAGRGATEQHEDLEASAERFLAACAELPAAAAGARVRVRSGRLVGVQDVPWMRWQELALHGADLDVGIRVPDGGLAARGVTEGVQRAEADAPGPARLQATDLDADWQLGHGEGPLLRGSSGTLLAWLAGRPAADALELVPPDAQLPALPGWG